MLSTCFLKEASKLVIREPVLLTGSRCRLLSVPDPMSPSAFVLSPTFMCHMSDRNQPGALILSNSGSGTPALSTPRTPSEASWQFWLIFIGRLESTCHAPLEHCVDACFTAHSSCWTYVLVVCPAAAALCSYMGSGPTLYGSQVGAVPIGLGWPRPLAAKGGCRGRGPGGPRQAQVFATPGCLEFYM